MKNWTVSKAMGSISDDLLLEAMKYEKKRQPAWKILRAAACLAVVIGLLAAAFWPSTEENIVTGPGLLTIRAYALNENEISEVNSTVLEEGVSFSSTIQYDPTKSYREHFPFSVTVDKNLYPGAEVTLEVFTDAGIFYKNEPYDPSMIGRSAVEQVFHQYYGQHFTVNADKMIYWQPNGFDYEYMKEQIAKGNLDFESAHKAFDFAKNPSYMDMIIRADEQIVGFCVIAVHEEESDPNRPARTFSFELLAAVSFPKVEGKWQNVTDKYVQGKIAELKER